MPEGCSNRSARTAINRTDGRSDFISKMIRIPSSLTSFSRVAGKTRFSRCQSSSSGAKKQQGDTKEAGNLPPVRSDYNKNYTVDSLPPKTFSVLNSFKYAKQGLVKH